jgi:hypothetical protein
MVNIQKNNSVSLSISATAKQLLDDNYTFVRVVEKTISGSRRRIIYHHSSLTNY